MKNQIATPSLIIMLGSTPCRAGLEFCRHMLTLSAEDQRRVVLVHIDTANTPGDLNNFYKEHEGTFRMFSLRIAIPNTIDYTSTPLEPQHTFIPSTKPKPFANGAGGIRNNGHVAAAFAHSSIRQILDEALHHLEMLGTSQGEKSIHEVHANILAFLGGGTGSGILPDITVMVRQLLLERLYDQRINLFCILPDWIQGSNNNDINWRKSNSVACLLELLALSLAADARKNLTYRKYMNNRAYDISADAIANEIYLIGRTSMASADDTARIVGLDLFQRVTDAGGVGVLEHDTWSNRRALGATDDRGLPTMFATSCPLEVRFPVHETARAFAQISASFLIPEMVGGESAQPEITEEAWLDQWAAVAEVTHEPQGNQHAVRLPADFNPSQFLELSTEVLDTFWDETKRRARTMDQPIKDAIRKKRQEELQEINHVPPGPQSQLTRRLIHLRQLEEEYRTVLVAVHDIQIELPDRPYYRSSLWQHLPFFGEQLRIRKANMACDVCNSYIREYSLKVRYAQLREVLEELLKIVGEHLEDIQKWFTFRENKLNRVCRELLMAGQSNAAWQGRLDLPHPHQRHIFDLHTLNSLAGRSGHSAVERLYMTVTFPKQEDERPRPGGEDEWRYDEVYIRGTINRHIQDCLRFINKGEEDGGMRSRDNFSEQVVAYFYDYYMMCFRDINLFELLDVGAALEGNEARPYLLEHLSHINGLVRDLIAFQETLWFEGPDRLVATLFLGIAMRNGRQQRDLIQAITGLGTFSDRILTPQVEGTSDPHRFQVAYGQHGLSLTSIPDFFRESNSSMAEYIHHQREWYGNQQPAIFLNSATSTYGQSRMPVHSSGEMERLVCDPEALGYQVTQAHASHCGTNLIGRVVREAEKIIIAPDWNGGNGAHPPTPPGQEPAQPQGPTSPQPGRGPNQLTPPQPGRSPNQPALGSGPRQGGGPLDY